MHPHSEESKRILRRVQEDGFLLLDISAAAQVIVKATFESARSFFQAPLLTKMKSRLPHDLGYRPFAAEYSHSPTYPDQMESFSVSFRSPEVAKNLKSLEANHLYETMLATFDAFESISETLGAHLANVMTNQTHHIPTGAFRPWSLLQLNYSRPSEIRTGLINELHEDGCLITIACTNGPGLEVRNRKGNLVPIATEPDEVIAMPGEILWLLSGGMVQPLYHRVSPDPSCPERMSLLFFGDIDPQLCRPWIMNEVNDRIDIGSRVLKNPSRFGLKEWTLE